MNTVGKRTPIRPIHEGKTNYSRVLDRTHDILNGGVNHGGIQASVIGASAAFSPGTQSIQGNTDTVHVKIVFNAPGDVDVTITHNLGRLPTGYRVASCNNPVMIYNGSVQPTTTQMTFRGHLGGANPATCILEIY